MTPEARKDNLGGKVNIRQTLSKSFSFQEKRISTAGRIVHYRTDALYSRGSLPQNHFTLLKVGTAAIIFVPF